MALRACHPIQSLKEEAPPGRIRTHDPPVLPLLSYNLI